MLSSAADYEQAIVQWSTAYNAQGSSGPGPSYKPGGDQLLPLMAIMFDTALYEASRLRLLRKFAQLVTLLGLLLARVVFDERAEETASSMIIGLLFDIGWQLKKVNGFASFQQDLIPEITAGSFQGVLRVVASHCNPPP